jgi:hypothetical protein
MLMLFLWGRSNKRLNATAHSAAFISVGRGGALSAALGRLVAETKAESFGLNLAKERVARSEWGVVQFTGWRRGSQMMNVARSALRQT